MRSRHISEQYGDRVLAAPPARGLNWLVYIIPPLVFLGGAFFLYRGLKAWKQLGVEEIDPAETEPNPEIEDEYIARLEEELKKQ